MSTAAGERRVALVTGAARGIGAASVRRLATDGYAVVALDWCDGVDPSPVDYPLPRPADLERLSDEYEAVLPVIGDVREPQQLADAVGRCLQQFGRLDAVVAAAAVMAGGRSIWETTAAELELLWQVDALGVWNTARAAIPAMLDGPDPSGCRFVAVASAAGHAGHFGLGAYTMAKHAVVGLVRALAADLVGTGVTAVAVSPGSTRTAMLDATARLYGLDDADELARHLLLERLLEPEEVAETIAFCCSPAGAVVNGSELHADGGSRG